MASMELDTLLDEDLEDPSFVPGSTDALLRSIVCEAVRSELKIFGEGHLRIGLMNLRDGVREDFKKELEFVRAPSKILHLDGAANGLGRLDALPGMLSPEEKDYGENFLYANGRVPVIAELGDTGEMHLSQLQGQEKQLVFHGRAAKTEFMEDRLPASKIDTALPRKDSFKESLSRKVDTWLPRWQPDDPAAPRPPAQPLVKAPPAPQAQRLDADGREERGIAASEMSRLRAAAKASMIPTAPPPQQPQQEVAESLSEDGDHRSDVDVKAGEKEMGKDKEPLRKESSTKFRSSRKTFEEDEHRNIIHFCRLAWRYLQGTISIEQFVNSQAFDNISGLFIFANAVTIGIQTDYLARNTTEVVPSALEVLDKLLAVIFLLELMLRMWADGLNFFSNPSSWRWNWFDFIMVSLQVLEELMRSVVFLFHSDHAADFSHLKIMRVMRVLRLIRVIRVVRIMRLINELRTIVASVMGSLKALFWTVVLLFLLLYICAVYFTQTVTDHRVEIEEESSGAGLDPIFSDQFGNLPVSVLSLYLSISGGADWQTLMDPFLTQISLFPAVIFVGYVAFVILCIMNVVTGVFVESALKNAQQEDDIFMVRNLQRIFKNTDTNESGLMNWEDFNSSVASPEMQVYFQSIDLDVSQAINLFKLIDVDDTGRVDLMHFVSQCTRLRGSARAIDLMTVLYETRRFARDFYNHAQHMEKMMSLCRAGGHPIACDAAENEAENGIDKAAGESSPEAWRRPRVTVIPRDFGGKPLGSLGAMQNLGIE